MHGPWLSHGPSEPSQVQMHSACIVFTMCLFQESLVCKISWPDKIIVQ